MPKDEKVRKRVVVEEVVEEKDPEVVPLVTPEVVSEVAPVENVVEPPKEVVEVPEPVVEVSESPQITPNVPDIQGVKEEVLPPTEPITAEDPPKVEEPILEPELIPELKSSSGTNPLFIIIPGIFLLGALLGGIYFYQSSLGNKKEDITPSPSPVVTVVGNPTPAASPSATLDLTKYPVNIMNGSGIVGEAGKVKTILTTAGFSVSATGNAASYDFTKTVIKAKADVPAAYLDKLTTTLSKTYVLDASQVLAISSPDSVQVIIGSTKAK